MGLFDLLRKKKTETVPSNSNESTKNKGSFLSFVLLDEPVFSLEQLVSDLKEDWNIDIKKDDKAEMDLENVTAVFSVDNMLATIGLIPAPVPDDEAVHNAETNFRWKEAVEVTKSHKAHLVVAVLSQDKPMMEAGTLLVKLGEACLKQQHAIAINTAGTVMEPNVYKEYAKDAIADGMFPILDLIFFGIYSNDNGKTISGYTFGLQNFNKDEIEVLDSQHSASEVFEFLIDIASYVVESDAILKDGETIGFSQEQKLPITKSKSRVLDFDTLKIGF